MNRNRLKMLGKSRRLILDLRTNREVDKTLRAAVEALVALTSSFESNSARLSWRLLPPSP